MAQSYRVGLWIRGERSNPNYNALRFATQGEAERYGEMKYQTWTMVDSYVVQECALEPNYEYTDGRLRQL